jgi:hypothetical protein
MVSEAKDRGNGYQSSGNQEARNPGRRSTAKMKTFLARGLWVHWERHQLPLLQAMIVAVPGALGAPAREMIFPGSLSWPPENPGFLMIGCP